MNALYITSKPIFPTVDGGNVASGSFLKCLITSGINVKHLTISTEKHPFKKDKYPLEIKQRTNPESVFIDTRIRPLTALKHLFVRGSYNINRFHSTKMEELIKKSNFFK